MILAAGQGSRLRPLTDSTPKPLIEIDGRPLIAHHLERLAAAGVRDVVINVHHLAEQFEPALGDGERWGLSITYSYEEALLETGGGIVKALPLLGDKPFWLLLGDIVCDFPLHHLPVDLAGDEMHMVLAPTPPHRMASHLGGDFDAAVGRVLRRGDGYVYTGIAVVDPSMLSTPPCEAFSFRDVFFPAVDAGRVSCQIWSGYWTDIGTAAQLEAARAHCESARP